MIAHDYNPSEVDVRVPSRDVPTRHVNGVDSLIFTLLVPPSTNGLFLNTANGRRAKTSVYKAWLAEAGYMIEMAWRAANRPAFVAPLRLFIRANVTRKRDISNLVKPIEDCLVKSIPGLPDDRWNDEVHITRDASLPLNKAVVTIRGVEPG